MKYTRLSHARSRSSVRRKPQLYRKHRQHGIALAIALILLGVLMVFTSLAATLMTSEARLSAAQYNNARTFNAGMASLELMTDRINTLFTSNFNPTAADIAEAADAEPIFKDGSTDLFDFTQKVTQLGGNRALVVVKDPPFEGLTARERLFRLEAIAQDTRYQTQVRLIRDVANYQIPIFQFAAFGFDSLDVSPGPVFSLGGRTHTNRNLFLVRRGGNVATFYGKITAVGEVCTEILPSGLTVGIGSVSAGTQKIWNPTTLSPADIVPSIDKGKGPDNPAVATAYDYNLVDDPTSPDGGQKSSGAGPAGLVVTGIPRLLLPTESQGFQAIEILRRAIPSDELPENEALQNTRFFNGIFARYSTIRILLDDDIQEFPDPIGTEPRAYDLGELADPNNAFWVALADNVRQFDPLAGSDHPDRAPTDVTAGAGGGMTVRVLPPQTNLINYQPEFQQDEAGNVSTLRKRSYIKIELLVNDQTPNPPLRVDITREILNLGITAGPIPVINAPLSAADLTGDNTDLSPTGRIRASTTYVRGYPLNDSRQSDAVDATTENMLPWLERSGVANNVGRFKDTVGATFPGYTLKLRGTDAAADRTAQITYRFEPNAILRLQRTYLPFNPNNQMDMTTADVPTKSDGGNGATDRSPKFSGKGRGEINDADTYPVKFKSLIAKPYFRFTDQFDNNTYVKGTTKMDNGMYEMANPFSMYSGATERQRLYNASINDANTRLIKSIRVYAARSALNNATNPGAPLPLPFNTLTSSSPNQILPAMAAASESASNVTTAASRTTDQLFTALTTWWTEVTSGANQDSPTTLALKRSFKRKFAKALRDWVFIPGIPGFYALRWNTAAGTTVSGDNLIDMDVDYRYPNIGANAVPTSGVVDLQEMTAFPNLDPATDQARLNAFRTNVASLTATDFPHLSWPNALAIGNPALYELPRYLARDPAAATPVFEDTKGVADFLSSLENVERGMTDPATAEIPKENLVFDWNGDGLIEPPHRPFQGDGTRVAVNSTITDGPSIGYSVESNICSLVPSTLTTSTAFSTTPPRTTSVPVEIRIVENDDGTIPFPTANIASTINGYQGTYGASGIPFSGQADPDPGATAGTTNGTNSIEINVPLGTLGVTRTLTKSGGGGYTCTVRVRSAIVMTIQHPLAGKPGIGTIGRMLGLTDSNYAYPGHCFFDFVSDPANDNVPQGTLRFLPRVRTVTDAAFPINTYDQREGRHINRVYGFQGIPTSADYHGTSVGGKAQRIVDNQWPNWPAMADDAAILQTMEQTLPMPSPVALERRGIMNIVELDLGNLKKLFRGDFDTYLGNASFAGAFDKGQPRSTPLGDPATVWGGNGIIDISDNGLMVYISDRRGDDNNDGIYEFNDVFGENDQLDPLDDTVNSITDPSSNQKGKPGDGILRRDIDVETQPSAVPTDNEPARTGESPHGSAPVNDGFEYFCGNIDITCRRVITPDPIHPVQKPAYESLLGGGAIESGTMKGVITDPGTAPSPTLRGAENWRIVDSAKTGRVRAFRRAVRIVNGWDIPRWYLNQDGPVPRHFTGMSLITENPVYIHGNLNSIGVLDEPSGVADNDSGIPVGGPTASRNFLQTGNANMPLVPSDFNSIPAVSGGADDALLHGPMAVMCDAVSIQSRSFTDAKMFICSRSMNWRPQNVLQRIAMGTTVKAAWLTGQPKAGKQDNTLNVLGGNEEGYALSGDSPNTQGGLHNFPRFCEDWGDSASDMFNYNGSFIFQFYSNQGNGPWLIGGANGANYGPPKRNWNFDQAFRKLGGLPPGTPRVSFYKIRGFRQVFIEDQD